MPEVVIFDLRHKLKPWATHPSRPGGSPRPHYTVDPYKAVARQAARRDGGIKRVLLHQWGVEVGLSRQARRATAEGKRDGRWWSYAEQLAYRAAGLDHEGNPLRLGGAPYHVSCGCTPSGIGVVALVWHRTIHTFHAEAENAESIGVGIMGRFARDGEEQRPRGFAMSLRHALAIARQMVLGNTDLVGFEGLSSRSIFTQLEPTFADDVEVELRTHSQTQRKPADPGLWAIRHGVADLVRRGAIAVDPLYYTGNGSPWPESWRMEIYKGETRP